MNEMTKKLIEDGKETNRVKFSRRTAVIGLILIIGGIVLMLIAGSTSYVAADGTLMEHFWMVPTGLLLVLCGVITEAANGIRFLIRKKA